MAYGKGPSWFFKTGGWLQNSNATGGRIYAWSGTALLKLDDAQVASFKAASGAGTSTYFKAEDAEAAGDVDGASIYMEPGLANGSGSDGKFCILQPGGTPGTDEIALWHDGTNSHIRAGSGQVRFETGDATGCLYWTGASLAPTNANARLLGGSTSAEWRSAYLGQDTTTGSVSTSGLYLGLDQEARLRWNKDATGYPAASLILGLNAVGSAAADRLALSAATVSGFAAAADTAGNDIFIATQTAGADAGSNPRGGNLDIELGLGDGAGVQGTLSINGPVSIHPASDAIAISGYSNQSTAHLGSELVTNGTFDAHLSSWTATNWSWSAGTALHTTTFTDALTQNISVTNGARYHIEFTISGRTAGTITPTLNGVNIPNSGSTNTYAADGTYKRSVVANATGSLALTFAPSADFDGALDNVTVKQITSGSTQVARWYDDSDAEFASLRGDAGLSNIGLGLDVLRLNTTGNYNSAVGYSALYLNTTGSSNSAMGYAALYSNTTGINNSAMGYAALSFNQAGSSNVAVGFEAGKGTSAADRSNNVVIGYQAGVAMQAANNNILIGYQTGDNITTASGAVLIGYDIAAASATGTGEVNIAGLYKGTVGAEAVICPNDFSTADSAVEMATGTWTHASGEGVAVEIKPTWNASGTAAETCLKINPTKTAVGSGIYCGIDLAALATDFAFKFAADATDPTGGGGAAAGRIPVSIGGATRYIPYY